MLKRTSHLEVKIKSNLFALLHLKTSTMIMIAMIITSKATPTLIPTMRVCEIALGVFTAGPADASVVVPG